MSLDLPAPTPDAESLRRGIAEAPAGAAGIAAFEVAFWRLPAFDSHALLGAAAAAYDAAGRRRPAVLLRSLQQQLAGGLGTGTVPDAVAELLRHPRPAADLLQRLVRLQAAGDSRGAVALFEAALPHVPPIEEYWVYYRVAMMYQELGRRDAAFLLASIALQMEPAAAASHRPAKLVIARLMLRQAWREAAALQARWSALHQDLPLLDPPALAELAAHVPPEPPALARGRHDRVVVAADERAGQPVRVVGRALPHALVSLPQAETRPAITVSELDDAVLLVADGAVSVWAADGRPQPELSVGMSPCLMRDLLHRRGQQGEPVVERELDQAMLLGDVFPAPNLCHFLLDHATRLAVYALAGLDLGTYVAVGPDLARPYQREIARRLGARLYLGTAGFGRLRVRRLAVASTCHALRHAAHLGADWALGAVRAGFADVTADVTPRRRLLVSRSDATGRRLVDEDAVLAALQPHGFERIVPGTLPLAEQVRAFAAATHVVAAHGAALANLAFCRPGTHVLEIFHPHYGTYAYALMAPTLSLDYTALVGFDGASEGVDDNDPALAADRADASLGRDVRADLSGLAAWLGTVS